MFDFGQRLRRGCDAFAPDNVRAPACYEFGGGDEKSSTTQTTTTDPQLKAALLGNLNRAGGIANSPFQFYGGEMTAPLSPNQNLAINAAPNVGTAGQDSLNSAISGVQGMAGTGPSASSFMSAWQNPYTDQVVNRAQGDILQARDRMLAGNTDSAIRSGAIGNDSRRGVADALTNEAAIKQIADTTASLRNTGFNTAAGYAQSDASRAQNDLSRQLQGYSLLGNFAGQQQNMANTGLNSLMTTGLLQQLQRQAQNDANYGEFQNYRNYPFQTQQLLNSSLGLMPNASTINATSTRPGESPLPGLLGAGVSLLGSDARGGGSLFSNLLGF